MSPQTAGRAAVWRRRWERGLGLWPAAAVAWLAHGGVVLTCLVAFTPPGFGLGTRTAIALGATALLVVEIALLTAAGALAETLSGGGGRLADAARGLAYAVTAGLLVASNLKFVATGIHLKRSDLWFARTNLGQILGEAPPAEAAALVAWPVAVAVLAALAFAAARLARRRGAPLGSRPFTALAAAAGVALAVAWTAVPAVPLFAHSFLPEVHWAARALAGPPGARGGAAARPAGETEGATGSGPAIEAWRPAAGARPLNVVVVMLESIPWARTAMGGGRAGVAPHLERLAAEAIVFSRAYAVSTHSDYAQVAILSSLYPRKYPHHDYYAGIDYPRTLLWDALAPAGWATAMFSCQNERWGNMVRFIDTPGLDVLRHSLDWPRARRRGRGSESKVFEETPVGEWIRWRRAHPGEPFLAYLNFQSNHFPYQVPPDAARPHAPWALDFPASFLGYPRDKVPVMLNRFHNALGYGDLWLGQVVAELERSGVWERTILVVVSDHGEAFYEHAEPTHGTSLHEEQLRSLWLMRLPGAAPRVIEEPVSLLDVAPTVLAALGLPAHGNFQGRSDLLAPGYDGRRRPLFFTLQGLTAADGVLVDGLKYIVDWDRGFRRLYDLDADPGERVDLLAERPDEAARLDALQGELIARQLDYYRTRGWERGLYAPRLP